MLAMQRAIKKSQGNLLKGRDINYISQSYSNYALAIHEESFISIYLNFISGFFEERTNGNKAIPVETREYTG